VSDHFDRLNDDERQWLRKERRSAARRSWLLIGVLVVAAIVLAWLTLDGLPGGGRAATTTTTTLDQRVIADGEQALADWGVFAVSNDLADVKDSFWANGPQYKQLAEESKERKALGPPPYTMTMTNVKVIKPGDREDQRVLRGDVRMTRPGEKPQRFNWDVWLQLDKAADGRWRLWTVRDTAGT
jgi:hypothetical protein